MSRFVPFAFCVLMISTPSFAQGLPVNMGPQAPVWVWFAGVVLLGLVMAYAIMRNRTRSSGEKKITDAATKANYAEEDRAAKSSEIDLTFVRIVRSSLLHRSRRGLLRIEKRNYLKPQLS